MSPKRFTKAERLKAVAILLETDNPNLTRAARQYEEQEGVSVSPSSIGDWASGMKPNLKRGRPVGTTGTTGTPGAPGPRAQRSPYRDRVLELWANGEGDSQAEIARKLGLTRANVSYLIKTARAS